jgi:aryl-alcohol dehydrogenase-like predicted oxidoreductase
MPDMIFCMKLESVHWWQAKGVPLASNQVQYSLLYRVPERNGVADAVKEADATLVAYSPLAQGLLTGAAADNLRVLGVHSHKLLWGPVQFHGTKSLTAGRLSIKTLWQRLWQGLASVRSIGP